ncbi:MAG: FKBP-type peptidyl-prolyl cis-trans isomerase [Hahellaceae bacterium]|nr:FKBP-type peptidyl-prolyl cis-trans isomerase [Hahellaceae bacterium]MCP5170383.1 FKBP-type peptidyl-prolyl cis-trans isomerase [Hahellaceae bacterium]
MSNGTTQQLVSEIDIVSYALGRQWAEQLASNGLQGINVQTLAAGVQDVIDGRPSVVNQDAIQAAWGVLSQKIEAEQANAAKAMAQEGEQFLQENAGRAEVLETPTGLQYEIIIEGSGEKPQAHNTVRTHYHGTFIDGRIFDSSYDRGEPAEFPVGGVIAGWTEALQMMPVGSKWRLYVPSHLAYGERGAPGAIPPHTALIFDVELLDIVG